MTSRGDFPPGTTGRQELGARLYGVKGFAQVTNPISLGESFGARVRKAVPVWFYRTTDERANAHHSLIQKKKFESPDSLITTLMAAQIINVFVLSTQSGPPCP